MLYILFSIWYSQYIVEYLNQAIHILSSAVKLARKIMYVFCFAFGNVWILFLCCEN